MGSMKAGVLALQGDVREHAAVLADLGASPVFVRAPEELAAVDCLAIPGGESTTIGRLARRYGLVEPIRERAEVGMPVLGTCAGMIVMATEVVGGDPLLSLLDVRVARNAYGRQVDSFEADVPLRGDSEPLRAVFIRAPVVEEVGDGVEVLAELDGRPVAVERDHLLAAAFHPELAGETRLHQRLLEKVG
ncbi:MAG TPA: pyridoxal 5'-phosphate synthase glutaminase subunit PdxT [Actinomycetota bacterium]|nr:pyridoxal 5'-phosphate synthase glutaminase subunit PdxT [Actinomycetota bacterium]